MKVAFLSAAFNIVAVGNATAIGPKYYASLVATKVAWHAQCAFVFSVRTGRKAARSVNVTLLNFVDRITPVNNHGATSDKT